MKRLNTFLEKQYNKPLLFHYIIWFIIMFTLSMCVIPLGLNISLISLNLYLQLMGGVSAIGALILMLMNWTTKQADKFWKQLEVFESMAKDATTSDELLNVRHQLIIFHNKKVSHYSQGNETRKLLTLIDTRLEYEFKITK